MSYTHSCRNITIVGPVIHCEAQKADKSWNTAATIDLSRFIGNNDGVLFSDKNGGRFIASVTGPTHLSADFTTLTAPVKKRNGEVVQGSLNIDKYLANLNGVLTWQFV